MLVDVHTHLTHPKFKDDIPNVVQRAKDAGLTKIIVNGLNPDSNRQTLQLADQYPDIIYPALGIYPIDAVNHLAQNLDFPVEQFDVHKEILFIREMAAAGKLIAIGECGLDDYWLDSSSLKPQEAIFEQLIEIAKDHNLPLIIHTRKAEKRCMEILVHHKVEKVDFHCFGGKVKLAKKWAEDFGWWFSIPANANVNEAFAKMLECLPFDKILTETDAPFLSPNRAEINEPKNVRGTIEILAKKRSLSFEQAAAKVMKNFESLFG